MIRPVTCVCVIAAAASGLYLYQTKHTTRMLDRKIDQTVQATAAVREQITMLKAEWANLNDTSRLTDLAGRHLSLHQIAPTQFVSLAELDHRLPGVRSFPPSHMPAAPLPPAPPAIEPAPVPVARLQPAAKPSVVAAAAAPAAPPGAAPMSPVLPASPPAGAPPTTPPATGIALSTRPTVVAQAMPLPPRPRPAAPAALPPSPSPTAPAVPGPAPAAGTTAETMPRIATTTMPTPLLPVVPKPPAIRTAAAEPRETTRPAAPHDTAQKEREIKERELARETTRETPSLARAEATTPVIKPMIAQAMATTAPRQVAYVPRTPLTRPDSLVGTVPAVASALGNARTTLAPPVPVPVGR